MNTDEHGWNALTERIISCVYNVSNELGCGFLENVYENAMLVALRKAGLSAQSQVRFKVFYQGVDVGEYIADVVVEGVVLLELKAARALDSSHQAQLLNYLRATGIEVGLLLNFGPKPEFKRLVFDIYKRRVL